MEKYGRAGLNRKKNYRINGPTTCNAASSACFLLTLPEERISYLSTHQLGFRHVKCREKVPVLPQPKAEVNTVRGNKPQQLRSDCFDRIYSKGLILYHDAKSAAASATSALRTNSFSKPWKPTKTKGRNPFASLHRPGQEPYIC